MDKITNKYIAVSYQLFDTTKQNPVLIEETSNDAPFDFISGLGIALETFENKVINLNKGDKFEFDLTPDQAYGEFVQERVVTLDKSIFEIDGKFDSEHIVKDAIIPLQNADGNRFNGRVMEITDKNVVIDLNHPLAGKTLHFTGEIKESRIATPEEVAEYVKSLQGGHCGGGCENCGGHCGEDGEKEGGCCGGHGDHEGGCCKNK